MKRTWKTKVYVQIGADGKMMTGTRTLSNGEDCKYPMVLISKIGLENITDVKVVPAVVEITYDDGRKPGKVK